MTSMKLFEDGSIEYPECPYADGYTPLGTVRCKHPKKEWQQCKIHTSAFAIYRNWTCPFNLHEELKAGAP